MMLPEVYGVRDCPVHPDSGQSPPVPHPVMLGCVRDQASSTVNEVSTSFSRLSLWYLLLFLIGKLNNPLAGRSGSEARLT